MVGKNADTEKKYPKMLKIKDLKSLEILTKEIKIPAMVPKKRISQIDRFDSSPPRYLLQMAPPIKEPNDGAKIVVKL